MLKIGTNALKIPQGVTINQKDDYVDVVGPKGNVKIPLKSDGKIQLVFDNDSIVVKRSDDEKTSKMMHGTMNALIANAIHGVTQLWIVKLNIVGVGYRAAVNNGVLTLTVGYSHPVEIPISSEITLTCPSPTEIVISAADKSKATQFADNIRRWRPPEPYKGKGILYEGEQIVRKVGKTAEGSKK